MQALRTSILRLDTSRARAHKSPTVLKANSETEGRPTAREHLLQATKRIGINIFSVPGDMSIRFFKVIEDDPDLTLFTLSRGAGVCFATIGSAGATRNLAVACTTYEAGALNILNEACAFQNAGPIRRADFRSLLLG